MYNTIWHVYIVIALSLKAIYYPKKANFLRHTPDINEVNFIVLSLDIFHASVFVQLLILQSLAYNMKTIENVLGSLYYTIIRVHFAFSLVESCALFKG